MKIIDLQTWKRKEHFEFFSKMKSPFFGIVAEVDCTQAYAKAKQEQISFFAWYMHKSMVAVNQVEELKYRLVDDEIVCYDTLDAGSTIGRPDGTFGFIYAEFSPDFNIFNARLQQEILEVQACSGLRLNNEDLKLSLIRHSTLPWTNFTGLLHPTNLDPKESVPKITFGKFVVRGDKKFLPVSIEAHHGLVDGLHLSQYLQAFQDELNK